MRALASDLLGRSNPKRAKEMATRLLSDRASFNRMIANDGVDAQESLRSAATKINYQGVALTHLIAEADLDGLTTVMRDGKLPEETRLGAIEALARMADEQAEEKLVEMGKAESEDVELRKAAWRGLRRSKRARQKQS